MPEWIRAAFVIARRDFVATVFRRTFLLFLLGPLFPVALGLGFGGMGSKLAADTERAGIAVVASPEPFASLQAARDRLAVTSEDSPPIDLFRVAPEADSAAQRTRLLGQTKPPVLGVLEGLPSAPHLTGNIHADGRAVAGLQHMLDDARLQSMEGPNASPLKLQVTQTGRSGGSLATGQTLTARAGQTLVFFLTILLAGAVLSQLLEEKSNKAIEILAAAVPIDGIFVGKLFAMLAISIVGIAIWTVAGVVALTTFSKLGVAAIPPPAIGWPVFVGLAIIYFGMAYLLIGAVFLGIGSQAASVREIQTLNMPVVLAQSMIYFFAASSVGHLDEPRGLAAAIFPLSSPFAMIGWAAERPLWWPHLAAILWQAAWVALILRVGARLFRRSVLKSGPARRWFWQQRRAV